MFKKKNKKAGAKTPRGSVDSSSPSEPEVRMSTPSPSAIYTILLWIASLHTFNMVGESDTVYRVESYPIPNQRIHPKEYAGCSARFTCNVRTDAVVQPCRCAAQSPFPSIGSARTRIEKSSVCCYVTSGQKDTTSPCVVPERNWRRGGVGMCCMSHGCQARTSTALDASHLHRPRILSHCNRIFLSFHPTILSPHLTYSL